MQNTTITKHCKLLCASHFVDLGQCMLQDAEPLAAARGSEEVVSESLSPLAVAVSKYMLGPVMLGHATPTQKPFVGFVCGSSTWLSSASGPCISACTGCFPEGYPLDTFRKWLKLKRAEETSSIRGRKEIQSESTAAQVHSKCTDSSLAAEAEGLGEAPWDNVIPDLQDEKDKEEEKTQEAEVEEGHADVYTDPPQRSNGCSHQ
eukprot:5910804-Amphidinium_carterae.1